MEERPIIFSTPMVSAILKGRKTMTRRIVKPQPDARGLRTTNVLFEDWHGREVKCPYGKVGDRLWVKETSCFVMLDHAPDLLQGMDSQTVYRASVHNDWMEYAKEKYHYKWTPSIYMPRYASRIMLEITNIKVERLQDISEQDAINEGVDFTHNVEDGRSYVDYMIKHPSGKKVAAFCKAKTSFITLWKSIYGYESWQSNPWVWCVSFKKL